MEIGMNKGIKEIKKYFPVMKVIGNKAILYRGKACIEVRLTPSGEIFIDKYLIDVKILSENFSILSKLYSDYKLAIENRDIFNNKIGRLLENISTFIREEDNYFVNRACLQVIRERELNNINGINFVYTDGACRIRGVKMSIFDILNKSEDIKSIFRSLELRTNIVRVRYFEYICTVSGLFDKVYYEYWD